jgi:hypothetical protein
MDTTKTLAHRNLRIKPLACLLLPLAIGDVACGSAMAASLQVTNCNDAGSGSLRDAIAAAHNGDTIDMTQLTCAKISLASGGLIVLAYDLTLRGPGANALTIAGSEVAHYSSVLEAANGILPGTGTLYVEGLRITDSGAQGYYASPCIHSDHRVSLNRSTVTACSIGGVAASSFSARDSTISDSGFGVVTGDGSFSLERSTISGNGSIQGCALEFWHNGLAPPPGATASISNSTISGNTCIVFDRPVTISNSTLAFNVGQVHLFSAPLTIESSILANNGQADLVTDAPISGHNNLIMQTAAALPADTIRTDPKLLQLADNGGPTQTHALASGSSAIDAGNNLAGLAADQRGFARVAGARADIGAFESNAAVPTGGSIGPGFTGSWFDPAQSGQGLMLEVLSDNRLLTFWFSFNPQGNQQAWFGGVGTYSGNTATITDVALPTGGRWIPNFDQNAIVLNPWGTLTFTFTDCNHGKVDFNSVSGYGAGSMNLLRLTQPAGLTCP